MRSIPKRARFGCSTESRQPGSTYRTFRGRKETRKVDGARKTLFPTTRSTSSSDSRLLARKRDPGTLVSATPAESNGNHRGGPIRPTAPKRPLNPAAYGLSIGAPTLLPHSVHDPS